MEARLADGRELPEGDLEYETARSGGPGGQHVNKVETKVTVRFDLAGTAVFSDDEKARLRGRLASRLDREGRLRVASQRHRSQAQNREAAVERLVALLDAALVVEAPRVATRPTLASRIRRRDAKVRRGAVKRGRGFRPDADE